MSIDTKGPWWKGTEFADIETYLRELKPGGYPVHRVVQARCTCGATDFVVEVDQEEELSRTLCTQCQRTAFVADSEEYWADADAHPAKCVHSDARFEVGLGLCVRDDAWVRWMCLGLRCTVCGVLSSPLDWKSDLELSDPACTRIG
jgi:hypothetical protein